MATSIDFNTRVLGHSSDQVLGYSDDFFYQHCTFCVLSCTNRAARKVPLERIGQQISVCRFNSFKSFQFLLFIFSPQKKKKTFHGIIIMALFLHTISSVNAQIELIFKMVRFFDQQKLTIYLPCLIRT